MWPLGAAQKFAWRMRLSHLHRLAGCIENTLQVQAQGTRSGLPRNSVIDPSDLAAVATNLGFSGCFAAQLLDRLGLKICWTSEGRDFSPAALGSEDEAARAALALVAAVDFHLIDLRVLRFG